MNTSHLVDQNQIKVSHGITIVLLLTAFIGDSWIPVALAAASQIIGSTGVPYAPYRLIYKHLIVPLNLIQPHCEPDNPQPHHFASLVGGLFDLGGLLALWAGLPVLGWTLVWIVIVLANLNVWISFCMGCWTYYQLHRLHVPGFTQAKIQ